MLHLRILGGAAVLASDGALTGAAGRRRALALLALVASARDDGLPRDRALALLWPELDSDRARNNLKQLVFSLRRALSPDVFAATGATLRLEPTVITVDVWAYEKAIADGALESAVARYGGPFLDGFSVPGLVDFERWVDGERERLARVHAQTLDTLAERARREGQFQIAAAWRRHLAALDPLSAKHAVSFVRALADAGDVPGALRHAHLFERLVRSELDADVGPDMRLLVTQLRKRSDPDAGHLVHSDEIAVLDAQARAAKSAEAQSASVAAPPTRMSSVKGATRALGAWLRPLRPRRVAIVALAVANLTVFAVGFLSRAAFFSPQFALGEIAPDLPATVVVYSFDGASGALTGELGRATAELLATSLDGGTGLTAIAAPSDLQPQVRAAGGDSVTVDRVSAARIAERLGARLYVTGRIVEVGGRLRLTAALHDRGARGDAPIARASADGTASEMFEAVDRVAAHLLAGRFPGTRGALARVAATTASSLPAAKSYFAAEVHLGTGRFSAAIDELRSAVRLDSGFALAYYRMSHAAELLGREAETRVASAEAVRVADRLDDHYRRVLAAAVSRRHGDIDAAEDAYTRLTLDYPDDADAWFGLGEALFHLNPLRGRPAGAARDAFVKVVELDPRHVEALVHLARIDALRGDSTAAFAWVDRAREQAPSDDLLARLALHVRALGGAPSVGSVDRQRLQRVSTLHRGPGPRELLTSTGLPGAERFAAQFLNADVAGDLAAYGHRLTAYADAARGQFRSALRHLDEAQESDVDSDMEVRSLIVVAGADALDSSVVARTRMAIERWKPSYLHNPDPSPGAIERARVHSLLRHHRLALIALRAGDAAAATAVANRLDADSDGENATARVLATSIRARVAAAAGDSAAALRLLSTVRWGAARRSAAAEPLDRLLRADLLVATGRPAEAVRWYSTFGEGAPDELPMLGFATLGLARALERMDDTEGALRQYRRVVELWENADEPLRRLVDAAAERVNALEAATR
ncbi:MAG TPA: tetratricopeptide repeat protein [Gemmatimonadaceae bacterium]|nr:tetratricopeptide repeat protein [Gemmatimonadaceae bacterium]